MSPTPPYATFNSAFGRRPRPNAFKTYTPRPRSALSIVGDTRTHEPEFHAAFMQFVDVQQNDAYMQIQWLKRAVLLMKRRGAPARYMTDEEHETLVKAYNETLLKGCDEYALNPTSSQSKDFRRFCLIALDPESIEGTNISPEVRDAIRMTLNVQDMHS